jgi:hypothetical protein
MIPRVPKKCGASIFKHILTSHFTEKNVHDAISHMEHNKALSTILGSD